MSELPVYTCRIALPSTLVSRVVKGISDMMWVNQRSTQLKTLRIWAFLLNLFLDRMCCN